MNTGFNNDFFEFLVNSQCLVVLLHSDL